MIEATTIASAIAGVVRCGAVPGSGGSGMATDCAVDRGGGGGGEGGVAAAVEPQFPQNAEPGVSGAPHLGHGLECTVVTDANETSAGASVLPHSLQKLASSRFTAAQRGQVAMGSS
jgi:hypothetical protein